MIGKRHLGADQRRALRQIQKRGRAGASAREIGETEAVGLRIGAKLVSLKLASVTRTNRFILPKWADVAVPPSITQDDGKRFVRIPSKNG
jgi:hypothetical protein